MNIKACIVMYIPKGIYRLSWSAWYLLSSIFLYSILYVDLCNGKCIDRNIMSQEIKLALICLHIWACLPLANLHLHLHMSCLFAGFRI